MVFSVVTFLGVPFSMTAFPAIPLPGGRRPVQIGVRAARALTAELARHNGPKTGLLIGAAAGSPVGD